jgi:hypothetical protein
LHYFKKAGWEVDWIETASDLVRKTFNRDYSDLAETVGNCEALAKKVCPLCIHPLQSIDAVKPASWSRNMFDELPVFAPPMSLVVNDELASYLNSEPEYAQDVLAWWAGKKTAYPRLSRMALDYLSIPGMYNSYIDWKASTN